MYEHTIQRTIEKLYEDERLRARLTDAEAQVVLAWAAAWIEQRVSAALNPAQAELLAAHESKRVAQKLTALNALKPGTLRLTEVLSVLEPELKAYQPLPREQVFKLITELVSAMWRLQPPVDETPAPSKSTAPKIQAV